MHITPITLTDFELFWPIFKNIVSTRESYAIEADISFDEAFEYWCLTPQRTFVSKQQEVLTGSYYLKPNAPGPAAHICNCGYMVAASHRGKGIGRELCLHSQQTAIDEGYKGMQFNVVVSTNSGALQLWKSLGFIIVGTIPEGFQHKTEGLVDTHIMYKALDQQELDSIR